MKRYNKVLIVLFLLLFIIEPLTFRNIKAAENEKNIILLIDNSGSMQTTDSKRLSLVAAYMLIDTLDSNTNLNILSFGDKVVYTKKLQDKPSRDILKQQLSEVKFTDKNTNLKDGMAEALDQLKAVTGEKIIIVLSDGREDIKGVNMEVHKKELDSIISDAQKEKIKIHSIGLSKDSDKEVLSNISNKTDGDYFYSENASGLFDIFSKILGNINGFYTIKQYITSGKTEEKIKLSSYVDEVIVKIASCEDKFPSVDVMDSKGSEISSISENRYKIYKFKNSEDRTLTITTKEDSRDSIIVQIKSKVSIGINSSSDTFEIPYKVPVNLQAVLNTDSQISDLHMYKVDEGKKEEIEKNNNEFKFTFTKDKPGFYPVFITACDGNDNIISAKYININVTDNTPFYYSEPIPEQIFKDKAFSIDLKQLDSSSIEKASGDVHVKYEDKEETFPFKFENGVLHAEVSLKNIGDVKISSQITVMKDGENHSYYLPYFKAKVIDNPHITFCSIIYNKPFKENSPVDVRFVMPDNLIYKQEKISLYDSNNNHLKDFYVKPKDRMAVITLNNLKKGSNLKFLFKTESDIKINSKVETNLRIMSPGEYFWYRYKIAFISLFILMALTAAFISLCIFIYNTKVSKYEFNKKISCRSSEGGNRFVSIKLNNTNNVCYLKFIDGNIKAFKDNNTQGNLIGHFILSQPDGNKITQGLKFLIKGQKIFKVKYVPKLKQKDLKGNPIGQMAYEMAKPIRFDINEETITIYFK